MSCDRHVDIMPHDNYVDIMPHDNHHWDIVTMWTHHNHLHNSHVGNYVT